MLILLAAACGGGSGTPAPAPDAPKAPPPAATTEIVVKGSDSEVNLVQKLAEAFGQAHPGARISVTGGGSGAGIAALIDGSCTLANSSRELKTEEKAAAIGKGVTRAAFVFATDGLAVIVPAASKVEELSLEQIGGLYRGETKDWAAVGGAAGPVALYGRQSSSGTYDYFKKAAVGGEYSPEMRQLNGTAEIVEAVAKDPTGVGYVAAGYLKDARGVKAVKIAGQAPEDEAAVLAGRYPLARPLYQFTNGKPTGVLKDFLAFEASDAGQAIVKEMGFYPIFDAKKADNAALLGG